jgi:hypothetical protein
MALANVPYKLADLAVLESFVTRLPCLLLELTGTVSNPVAVAAEAMLSARVLKGSHAARRRALLTHVPIYKHVQECVPQFVLPLGSLLGNP